MPVKLFDSELKVMDLLWKQGDQPARQLAQTLSRQVGWNKNTTYTVIKKCIQKGAIDRSEPGFVCSARITRKEAQTQELGELVDRMFDGSYDKLFAALLSRQPVPDTLLDRLRQTVEGDS